MSANYTTAVNAYSSIPNTRFSNLEGFDGTTWSTWTNPVPALDDEKNGYAALGGITTCGSGTFVAGTTTELDCDNISVGNAEPAISDQYIPILTNDSFVIDVVADDFDNDQLQFWLETLPVPFDGVLLYYDASDDSTSAISSSVRIPNAIDPTTLSYNSTKTQLQYGPRSDMAVGDIVQFDITTTDGRPGHVKTSTITIEFVEEPVNVTTFYDDFENYDDFESALSKWIAVDDPENDDGHDYDYWKVGIADSDFGVPTPDGNYGFIQDCDVGCTLTMLDPVDITQLTEPWITFDRYMDNLKFSEGDYYDIDFYDGNSWINVGHWDNNVGEGWSTQNMDLASYTNANFKMRVSAIGDDIADHVAIDNVRIYDLGPPDAVDDLSATGTSSSVTLNWNTPFNGGNSISGYKIQRQSGGSSYTTLESSYGSSNTVSYTDTTVSDGEEYTYRIQAINVEGTSSYSNTASFTTPDSTAPRIDTINRQDPVQEATTNSALTFRVTFDEDVTGVGQTDFTTGGTATSSITGFTANSATQYDVVATVTADGTVSLELKSSGHGITDTASSPNALTNITPLTTAQTYIVTLPITSKDISSSTGSGTITLSTDAGTFSTATSIDESTLPTTGKPSISFPDGFFSWTITGLANGQQATVTITLPNPTSTNTEYWKVIDDTWIDVSSLLGSNDGDAILTLTITDGGLGDADGIVNGEISDPGGPGIPHIPELFEININETLSIASFLDITYVHFPKIFNVTLDDGMGFSEDLDIALPGKPQLFDVAIIDSMGFSDSITTSTQGPTFPLEGQITGYVTITQNLFGSSTTDLTVSANQIVEVSSADYRNLTIEDGGVLLVSDGIIRINGNYIESGTGHIEVSQSGCVGGTQGISVPGDGGLGTLDTVSHPGLPASLISPTFAVTCTDLESLSSVTDDLFTVDAFVAKFNSLLGTVGSDGTIAATSGDGGSSGEVYTIGGSLRVGIAGGMGGQAANGVDGAVGGGKLAIYANHILSDMTIIGKGVIGNDGIQGTADTPSDYQTCSTFGDRCIGWTPGYPASSSGTLGSEGGQGAIVYLVYNSTTGSANPSIDVSGGLGGFNGAIASSTEPLTTTRANTGAGGFYNVLSLTPNQFHINMTESLGISESIILNVTISQPLDSEAQVIGHLTILPTALDAEGQMTGYVTITPQPLDSEAQVIGHLTILPTALDTEGQMTGYVTLIAGNPQEAQIIGLLTILP